MPGLSSVSRVGTLVATAAVVLCAVVLAGARSAAADPVQSGDLDWGIKASFRSYVVGPIAKGAIDTDTARNGDGSFSFAATGGDATSTAVSASFGGNVHFTGHDGQLDMTVTDVKVQINGASGTIIADVVSKNMTSGELISYPDTAIANLNVAAVTPVVAGNQVSWTGIPSTLSEAGAPAFAGFYGAGTELDPVSVTLTTAAPAQNTNAPSGATTAAGGAVPSAVVRAGGPPSDGVNLAILFAAGVSLLAVSAGAFGFCVRSRRVR